MTNFEYIKGNLTELDLAYYTFPHDLKPEDKVDGFFVRVCRAWFKWAESASNNKGSLAAGEYNGRIIKEDPSIWACRDWYFPDGIWRRRGRNYTVSFLVWLSKQYNPEDWVENE